MKDWKDVPEQELRDVCRQLFEGLWGDNVGVADPIPLPSKIQLIDGKDTRERAAHAVKTIHMDRVMRVARQQVKNLEQDVLLMGVGKTEKEAIESAIKSSLRDYLRPLANLVELWDEELDDEGEVNLAAAEGDPGDGAVAPEGAGKEEKQD